MSSLGLEFRQGPTGPVAISYDGTITANVSELFQFIEPLEIPTKSGGSVTTPAVGWISLFLDTDTSKVSYKDAGGVAVVLSDPGPTGPSGSNILTRTTVTSPSYSVLLSDQLISVQYTSTAPVTITLPQSSSVAEGKTFTIVDEDGNAGTNNITIVRSGSDLLNGQTQVKMNQNYMSLMFYGTAGENKWFIM